MRVAVWCLLLTAAVLAQGSGNPDRGLPIYKTYCVACHGYDGRGDGPMSSLLSRESGIKPLDLSDSAYQDSLTDAELAHRIAAGGRPHLGGAMPAWGTTLAEDQLADLVAYVRELRGGPPEAPMLNLQELLEQGRILYTLRCLGCHGPEGRGDGPFMLGPALTSLGHFSDDDLMGLIADGHRTTSWDIPLSVKELESLVLFLRTLRYR